MNAQQLAQFQNQLLSMEEVVYSQDNKIKLSINGQCKVQSINLSDDITLEEVKTALPIVINEGLTTMGQKVQKLLLMQQQMS
jgi:DNA-binding protein YbaB